MRPSDMDAIARVMAQQAKQIVDQKLAALEPQKFDTSALEDQIADLTEQNKSLVGALADLRDDCEAQRKTIDVLLDRLQKTEAELDKRVTSDEFDAVALTVASCVKVDDHVAVINSIEGRIKDIDMGLGEVSTDLNKRFDTLSDLKSEIVAMLPDELDHDVVVGQVVERIMKNLPDMVKDAAPKIDMGEIRETVRDAADTWLSENRDDLRGPKGDKGDAGDAAQPLPPTDLQIIEAVKAVYPSIRQDLIRRLPAMEHKGVWNADTQYDVGDEVIKNGSTYRLMEPSTDAPPSDAWQMISQGKIGKKGVAGKDGEKGEKGDPGPAGVGIKDVIFEDSLFVVELDDGTIKEFDLSSFIDKIIDKIGDAS